MNLESVVIDTNVFISALLNPNGTPKKVINLAVNQYIILQSELTYQELNTRLSKKKFDKYLSQEDRLDFLSSLRKRSLFIEINDEITVCADADDNKFLELAVSCQAEYLITGDNDLLEIKNYQNIPIVTPVSFLCVVKDK